MAYVALSIIQCKTLIRVSHVITLDILMEVIIFGGHDIILLVLDVCSKGGISVPLVVHLVLPGDTRKY